jgi:hypothetical protein
MKKCLEVNKKIAEFMGENITHSDPDTNMNTVAEKGDKFRFNCKYIPPADIYCADLKFTEDWNLIMGIGDKMQDMVIEGNWGRYANFSDETHSFSKFERACFDRDKSEAIEAILDFIEAINNQDPEMVKQVKKYG